MQDNEVVSCREVSWPETLSQAASQQLVCILLWHQTGSALLLLSDGHARQAYTWQLALQQKGR